MYQATRCQELPWPTSSARGVPAKFACMSCSIGQASGQPSCGTATKPQAKMGVPFPMQKIMTNTVLGISRPLTRSTRSLDFIHAFNDLLRKRPVGERPDRTADAGEADSLAKVFRQTLGFRVVPAVVHVKPFRDETLSPRRGWHEWRAASPLGSNPDMLIQLMSESLQVLERQARCGVSDRGSLWDGCTSWKAKTGSGLKDPKTQWKNTEMEVPWTLPRNAMASKILERNWDRWSIFPCLPVFVRKGWEAEKSFQMLKTCQLFGCSAGFLWAPFLRTGSCLGTMLKQCSSFLPDSTGFACFQEADPLTALATNS